MINLTDKKRNELLLGEAKGVKERYDEIFNACKEIEIFLENEEITVRQYRQYQDQYDLYEAEMSDITSFFEETYDISLIEDEYNNDLEFESETEIEEAIKNELESYEGMLENSMGLSVELTETFSHEEDDYINALITCTIEHDVKSLNEYVDIEKLIESLNNNTEYDDDPVYASLSEDGTISIYCNDIVSDYHFGWDREREEWNEYNERDSYYIYPLENRYYFHGKKLVVYGDFIDCFVTTIDELKIASQVVI